MAGDERSELLGTPGGGRRSMVPTDRQLQLGVGPALQGEIPDEEVVSLPSIQMTVPAPRMSSLRVVLRQFNPFAVAGDAPLRPLLAAGVSNFFSRADDGAVGLLIIAMIRDLHVRANTLYYIGPVTLLVVFLMSPISGYLADRANRAHMAVIGEVLSNISILFGAFAGSAGTLVASRAGNGIGGVLKSPVQAPLLADVYPTSVRGSVFAFVGSWGFLGALVGPLIGAGLETLFGWRVSFFILGAAGLVGSLLWVGLREPVRGRIDRLEQGFTDAQADVTDPPLSWGEGWRAATSIASLRRLWIAAPFQSVALVLLPLLFLTVFAFYYGFSLFQLGLLGVGGAAVSYIALLYLGPLVQRYVAEDPARIMFLLAAQMVVTAIGLIDVIVAPRLWVAFVGLAAINVMGSVSLPATQTLISLVIPPRIRGFGLATTGPWTFGGIFVGLILITSYGGQNYFLTTILLPGCFLAAAVVLGTAGAGVSRDIRAARASLAAEEEMRRRRLAGDAPPALLCREVEVTYSSSQVLFGVDLEVQPGEIVALLGTNGAGKSSLLRAITGVEHASSGAVFVDGVDITHKPPFEISRLGVVFMPGGRAVFPNLTVAENLRAAAWAGAEAEPVAGGLDAALEHFPELRPKLETQAGNLSGGEQQMVALGQALVMRPRLLLIDELSLGLAPTVVDRLLRIVREINAQGTTVILVEQSVNVALTIAPRAVFMDKGEIKFDGATSDLLRRPELVRSVFFAGSASAGHGAGFGSPVPLRAPHHGLEEAHDGPRLSVEHLSLSYGGHRVLDGITFSVEAGSITGVIGPNGAGKTSLLDAISGYVGIDAGSIRIDGEDVTRLSPDQRARQGLGRSFQNARLFGYLSVRENIGVALERHIKVRSATAAALWLPVLRRSERRIWQRVDQLIELLNLEAYADKFVNECSVGTRRTVDIACIMAAQPSVLLLDEPSSGVSQAEIENFAPIVQRLARDTSCAIVCIEHDIPLVTAVSDRLVVLELGQLIAEGQPREVLDRPEVIAAYLAGADPSVIRRSGDAALARSPG